ncbi:MAG: sugar ABC transporter permease [Chloroflexi bacterium]|nr:sugar ABC transporter permease [Chloroflexota bacterium]MCY3938825.1 sugar ABC transporter permease [Chloroflexota bacterium]
MAVAKESRRFALPTLSIRHREAVAAYLFVMPWILGLLIFAAYPVGASLVLSFTQWDLLTEIKYVGADNYVKMFTDDRYFPITMGNTAYYTFIGVPLHTLVALLLAVPLTSKLRGIRFFRTAWYVPSVTPAVAAAVLWILIYHPEFGMANVVLELVGIPPQRWIFDQTLAKPSFILMSLWSVGGQMVIFIAALQGVPQQLYEAASIDGAGRWGRFMNVTLPLISPATFFNLVIGVIASFQIFTAAYIMTRGGPANQTLFFVLQLYRNAFQYLKFGYASAMAWVLFVIILFFTGLQFFGARRWVYYEAKADE